MLFAILIHKDPASDYGVTVPDLPGCFSVGRTLDEAIANAREAMELHIEGMLDDGLALPVARRLDRLMSEVDRDSGAWCLVDVDLAALGGTAQRVNITIPERILRRIDAAAASLGVGRSSFLVSSAMERIAAREQVAKPPAARESRGRYTGRRKRSGGG